MPPPPILKSSVAVKLLQCHYKTVTILREYLLYLCAPSVILETDNDTEEYRLLLNTTVVTLNEPLHVSTAAKFEREEISSRMFEVRLFDAFVVRVNWLTCHTDH